MQTTVGQRDVTLVSISILKALAPGGPLSIFCSPERLPSGPQPFHHDSEKATKYLCLGYSEEKKLDTMPR